MNKAEMAQRVLKDGEPLSENDFVWDAATKTFSSSIGGLVIDFSGESDCTFETGSDCTFDTGSGCTFKTSFGCTFKTSFGCAFETGSDCTFKTSSDCTFKTSFGCTFKTGFGCTFNTGSGCTFKTSSGCTFKTGFGYNRPYPPLQFTGSRYFMEYEHPGKICSGCISKPIEWWEENIVRCAEKHRYTPEQIMEYQYYVQAIKAWAKHNKLY